jgi:hypothetical protein
VNSPWTERAVKMCGTKKVNNGEQVVQEMSHEQFVLGIIQCLSVWSNMSLPYFHFCPTMLYKKFSLFCISYFCSIWQCTTTIFSSKISKFSPKECLTKILYGQNYISFHNWTEYNVTYKYLILWTANGNTETCWQMEVEIIAESTRDPVEQ